MHSNTFLYLDMFVLNIFASRMHSNALTELICCLYILMIESHLEWSLSVLMMLIIYRIAVENEYASLVLF